ncbi:MAG: hypothetical protein DRI74_09915 [Bacteroidetes bacterium]|nr:MAG: hypothetical protein DRI74_09915 [Bacteroidota bacterium]
MKHFSRKIVVLLSFLFLLIVGVKAQKYKTAKVANQSLIAIAQANSAKVKVHKLAQTFSGKQISIYEFGTETKNKQKLKPAIFIMANAEGNVPIATEAALVLAKELVKDKNLERFTWYLVPVLNADALDHYFENPLWNNTRNARPHNDDMDDAIDEDGPDDLNGDGFISQMRVADPMGVWIPEEADARFMRKANTAKGEKGIYKLYTEGVDNDGDGVYNEDSKGGINSGINFPHLFKANTATGGDWPGSEPEVYALMKFIYAHPEIAATFTFGSSDFCIQVPQGGRRGSADFTKIKIPKRMAEQFGADPDRTYTMDEVIELAQPMIPEGMELTPAMVAGFLGLGAAVNPLAEDLNFYKELSKQYKEYLKAKGFNVERMAPERAKDGSFELWSYYHLGIPTFSMNFFTLPKAEKEKNEVGSGVSLDDVEKMRASDFVALGEEKIALFLKENNAPERFSAVKIVEMMNAGQVAPAQMVGMMKQMPKQEKEGELNEKTKAFIAYDKEVLNGDGFVNWTSFEHPTLGTVEIGGEKAYVRSTPRFEESEKLISIQMPWVFELAAKLPRLSILKTDIEAISANIYKMNVWVQNENYLPFPTAMGSRNNRPAPAILLIDGENVKLVNGKVRTPINKVDGLKSVKLSFLIQAKKGTEVSLKLESKFAGNDKVKVTLSK